MYVPQFPHTLCISLYREYEYGVRVGLKEHKIFFQSKERAGSAVIQNPDTPPRLSTFLLYWLWIIRHSRYISTLLPAMSTSRASHLHSRSRSRSYSYSYSCSYSRVNHLSSRVCKRIPPLYYPCECGCLVLAHSAPFYIKDKKRSVFFFTYKKSLG